MRHIKINHLVLMANSSDYSITATILKPESPARSGAFFIKTNQSTHSVPISFGLFIIASISLCVMYCGV